MTTEPKKRYAGRFVPYRKPRNPVPPKVDQELVDFTQIVSTELQTIVLAMDTYPDKGGISVRDSNGTLWEVTIQRSDALWLRGETELQKVGRK